MVCSKSAHTGGVTSSALAFVLEDLERILQNVVMFPRVFKYPFVPDDVPPLIYVRLKPWWRPLLGGLSIK